MQPLIHEQQSFPYHSYLWSVYFQLMLYSRQMLSRQCQWMAGGATALHTRRPIRVTTANCMWLPRALSLPKCCLRLRNICTSSIVSQAIQYGSELPQKHSHCTEQNSIQQGGNTHDPTSASTTIITLLGTAVPLACYWRNIAPCNNTLQRCSVAA